MIAAAQTSSTGRRQAPAAIVTSSGTRATDQLTSSTRISMYHGVLPNEVATPWPTLIQA